MALENENPSADLGGLKVNPDNQNSGDNPAPALGSASSEVIAGRKKRSDAGQPRGARGGGGQKSIPGVLPLTPQAFAALYDPKIWSRVLASPADAAAAVTGGKEWQLSEEERTTLGQTGSVAAQCFAVADPRWLAVSLAVICIAEIYSVRFAMWKARVNAEKKANTPDKK
jgi:hypothetical protein